jgi:arginyl-tRNA synthetase
MESASLQVSIVELPSPRGERETMDLLRDERDQKQEKVDRSGKWEEVQQAAKLAERRANAAESQRYSMLPAELEGNTNFDWDAPPSYEQSFGNNRRNVHTSVLGTLFSHGMRILSSVSNKMALSR